MPLTRAERRRAVAEAGATLAQMSDLGPGEEPKAWDDLDEQDRDDALALADQAIKLVDALLAPVLEGLGRG